MAVSNKTFHLITHDFLLQDAQRIPKANLKMNARVQCGFEKVCVYSQLIRISIY